VPSGMPRVSRASSSSAACSGEIASGLGTDARLEQLEGLR
jgi:hypothetical protein